VRVEEGMDILMSDGKLHHLYPENSHIAYVYEEISINDRNSLEEHARDHEIRQKFWHVHTGDIVFDIGAGFGAYTLCALARGAKFVYAFENNPNVMRALRANLDKNKILNAPEKCSASTWRVDDKNSLDKFIEEMSVPLNRVSWIKIDTGDVAANINVLQGARRTIARFKPNVLINAPHDIVTSLAEYGKILYNEEQGHGLVIFEKSK
jgi:hypothetical protein